MELFLLVVAVVAWVSVMKYAASFNEPVLAPPMPYSIYF
jgi:hypothetical protein